MNYLDLSKQNKPIEKEIIKAAKRIMGSSNFILGKSVSDFENKIAAFLGTKYAVGLNSGSDALFLALKVLGIKKGDEVITTPFTMMATIEAIRRCEATPVFADIEPESCNIDAKEIIKKITKKTKAILPVHLFGYSAEMDIIKRTAKKYNLFLVEDVAQAIGAKYKSKMVGSFGDAGCLSFFPTKNLGGYGDGGAIVTNNKELYDMVKIMRAHGAKEKYIHEYFGINSRLDSLQAVILNVKLKYLPLWNKERRKKAEIYRKNLDGVGDLVLPHDNNNRYHVYHQFTLHTKKRDKLRNFLTKNNIPTQVYYPLPSHLQPILRDLGYKKGDMPNAEKAVDTVLSLPLYPGMPLRDQKKIIDKIIEFYN